MKRFSNLAAVLVLVLTITAGCAFLAVLNVQSHANTAYNAARRCVAGGPLEAAIEAYQDVGTPADEARAGALAILGEQGNFDDPVRRAAVEAMVARMEAAIAGGGPEAAARAAFEANRLEVHGDPDRAREEAAACECSLDKLGDPDHFRGAGSYVQARNAAAAVLENAALQGAGAFGVDTDELNRLASRMARGFTGANPWAQENRAFVAAIRGGTDPLRAEAAVRAAEAQDLADESQKLDAWANELADAAEKAEEAEAATRQATALVAKARAAAARAAGNTGEFQRGDVVAAVLINTDVPLAVAEAVANAGGPGPVFAARDQAGDFDIGDDDQDRIANTAIGLSADAASPADVLAAADAVQNALAEAEAAGRAAGLSAGEARKMARRSVRSALRSGNSDMAPGMRITNVRADTLAASNSDAGERAVSKVASAAIAALQGAGINVVSGAGMEQAAAVLTIAGEAEAATRNDGVDRGDAFVMGVATLQATAGALVNDMDGREQRAARELASTSRNGAADAFVNAVFPRDPDDAESKPRQFADLRGLPEDVGIKAAAEAAAREAGLQIEADFQRLGRPPSATGQTIDRAVRAALEAAEQQKIASDGAFDYDPAQIRAAATAAAQQAARTFEQQWPSYRSAAQLAARTALNESVSNSRIDPEDARLSRARAEEAAVAAESAASALGRAKRAWQEVQDTLPGPYEYIYRSAQEAADGLTTMESIVSNEASITRDRVRAFEEFGIGIGGIRVGTKREQEQLIDSGLEQDRELAEAYRLMARYEDTFDRAARGVQTAPGFQIPILQQRAALNAERAEGLAQAAANVCSQFPTSVTTGFDQPVQGEQDRGTIGGGGGYTPPDD